MCIVVSAPGKFFPLFFFCVFFTNHLFFVPSNRRPQPLPQATACRVETGNDEGGEDGQTGVMGMMTTWGRKRQQRDVTDNDNVTQQWEGNNR